MVLYIYIFFQNSKVPDYVYKIVTVTVEFLSSSYRATDYRTVQDDVQVFKGTSMSRIQK